MEKASDYKDSAVDTFQDTKQELRKRGEITARWFDKNRSKTAIKVADFAKKAFELIKEKTAQVTPEQADVEAETKAIVDDIVVILKISLKKQKEAK